MCNAFAERHVREIRETLDDLILLGEAHLRRTLTVIEEYHNARRPHQGISNVIPLGFDYPAEPALADQVKTFLWRRTPNRHADRASGSTTGRVKKVAATAIRL